MTFSLTTEEALSIAHAVIGAPPEIRDLGLVEAALARPQASVFGTDAYPTLDEKAAAMLQSLLRNHPLVDGNKRMAFACTTVFLHANGQPLTLTQDDAYGLVIAIVTGELETVPAIASALREWRTSGQREA